MILKQLQEPNTSLRFNKIEATKLLEYAKESYFKHLRLYEYVFNNTTASEIKRLSFNQEVAKKPLGLGEALQISKGRPKDAFERGSVESES